MSNLHSLFSNSLTHNTRNAIKKGFILEVFYGGAEATKLELLINKFIENLRKPEIYDATRMIDFRKLSIKVA